MLATVVEKEIVCLMPWLHGEGFWELLVTANEKRIVLLMSWLDAGGSRSKGIRWIATRLGCIWALSHCRTRMVSSKTLALEEHLTRGSSHEGLISFMELTVTSEASSH